MGAFDRLLGHLFENLLTITLLVLAGKVIFHRLTGTGRIITLIVGGYVFLHWLLFQHWDVIALLMHMTLATGVIWMLFKSRRNGRE